MKTIAKIIEGYFFSIVILGLPLSCVFIIYTAIKNDFVVWLITLSFLMPFVLIMSILFAYMMGIQ